jgi:hypothetical protein
MSKRRQSKYRSRIRIGEQIIAHPVALLKSEAWRGSTACCRSRSPTFVNASGSIQRDFFRLLIPPCGRSSESFCVVEQNFRGDYRCLRCDCVAPSVTVPSS